MAKDKQETAAAGTLPAAGVQLVPREPAFAEHKPDAAKFVELAKKYALILSNEQRVEVIRLMGEGKPKEVAPAPKFDPGVLYRFQVTWQDDVDEVIAANDREAWSKYCDRKKRWPSPRTAKVVCLGPADVDAAAVKPEAAPAG